jgi:hypothetical protein
LNQRLSVKLLLEFLQISETTKIPTPTLELRIGSSTKLRFGVNNNVTIGRCLLLQDPAPQKSGAIMLRNKLCYAQPNFSYLALKFNFMKRAA